LNLRNLIITTVIALLLFPLCYALGQSATLRFRLSGVETDRGGVIRCAVFRAEDEWLGDHPFRTEQAAPNGSTVTCTFDDLPPGRYGLTALHDEDRDGEMDRTLGVPSEGYAISERGEGGFEGTIPPDFEEAAFDVRGTRTVRAPMSY